MINTGLFWEEEGQVWRAGDMFANQNSRMLWSVHKEGKEIMQNVSFSGLVCEKTELSTQVILWRFSVVEQGIRCREKTFIWFSGALWEFALNPILPSVWESPEGLFWTCLESALEVAGTPPHPALRWQMLEQMATDSLQGCMGRQQWVIDGHQRDWTESTAPGQSWHFMEWMMPPGFTPCPSPWWLRSTDSTKRNILVLAGSTLTFCVTAGASLGCPPLHFQD